MNRLSVYNIHSPVHGIAKQCVYKSVNKTRKALSHGSFSVYRLRLLKTFNDVASKQCGQVV